MLAAPAWLEGHAEGSSLCAVLCCEVSWRTPWYAICTVLPEHGPQRWCVLQQMRNPHQDFTPVLTGSVSMALVLH